MHKYKKHTSRTVWKEVRLFLCSVSFIFKPINFSYKNDIAYKKSVNLQGIFERSNDGV